jgi:predicted nucleic acid-binding protein
VRIALAQRLGVRLAAPDDGLLRRALAWTRRLDGVAAYDGFYLALSDEVGYDLWTAGRPGHGLTESELALKKHTSTMPAK